MKKHVFLNMFCWLVLVHRYDTAMVCVFVCVCVSVCVYVCVRERERVCVYVLERERECVC